MITKCTFFEKMNSYTLNDDELVRIGVRQEKAKMCGGEGRFGLFSIFNFQLSIFTITFSLLIFHF